MMCALKTSYQSEPDSSDGEILRMTINFRVTHSTACHVAQKTRSTRHLRKHQCVLPGVIATSVYIRASESFRRSRPDIWHASVCVDPIESLLNVSCKGSVCTQGFSIYTEGIYTGWLISLICSECRLVQVLGVKLIKCRSLRCVVHRD